MNLSRVTYVEINLAAIRHNVKEIRKFIGSDVKLGAVIKANAYGHGAVKVGKVLVEEKVDYLCVACLSEALELRNNGIEIKILIMGHIPNEAMEYAIENNISITIFTLDQAVYVNNISENIGKKASVHIKIDTGFNRLGFKVGENTLETLKEIYSMKNLIVEGIFSHLALLDKEHDYDQYKRFDNLLKLLDKNHICIPTKHICDSIGMVAYKEFHMDMVRVGASLYGYNSRKSSMDLKPSLAFKSKIVQVRELEKEEGVSYDYTFIAPEKMKVGTIPCGYADGIPRTLSNKGYVYINGFKANIIGKMCMDQCMVDLRNIPNPMEGMEVVFYGENGPSLLEVADTCDTNRNELLSIISRRVNRVYHDHGKTEILDYLLD